MQINLFGVVHVLKSTIHTISLDLKNSNQKFAQ